LPLIPRITTNKFLLILLYKGHAIKKTCDDIVTKKYDILIFALFVCLFVCFCFLFCLSLLCVLSLLLPVFLDCLSLIVLSVFSNVYFPWILKKICKHLLLNEQTLRSET
jgi:hypothetical protein